MLKVSPHTYPWYNGYIKRVNNMEQYTTMAYYIITDMLILYLVIFTVQACDTCEEHLLPKFCFCVKGDECGGADLLRKKTCKSSLLKRVMFQLISSVFCGCTIVLHHKRYLTDINS